MSEGGFDRIWASPEHPDDDGYGGFWIKSPSIASVEYIRADLHTARIAALEARVRELEEVLRKAHDTLWEINPNNYDHDEVCKLNDASVEAILIIAPLIGETHGKSPEWWAARALLGEKP